MDNWLWFWGNHFDDEIPSGNTVPPEVPKMQAAKKAIQRYGQFIAVNAARARLGKPPLSDIS